MVDDELMPGRHATHRRSPRVTRQPRHGVGFTALGTRTDTDTAPSRVARPAQHVEPVPSREGRSGGLLARSAFVGLTP